MAQRGPLAGLTVVDCTQYLSGPFCTMLLGDMGATVLKIEPPDGGDKHRAIPPFIGSESAYFLSVNRNKKSIVVDLKRPEGQRIVARLAGGSDIFVENTRPGVMDRLGLGYQTLKEANPRLIYCSISGFGQTGPYRDRPGFDQIVQGMSGLMSVTGTEATGPLRVGLSVGDLFAGLMATYGILAALWARDGRGDGNGQLVTTSLLESLLAVMTFQAGRYFATGKTPAPTGNDHPLLAPTGVYPTRNGYITIGGAHDQMWARLCKAIGLPELVEEPRFRTLEARVVNRAALNQILSDRLAQRDQGEWVEILNQAGVPCGPVYTVEQAFLDVQAQHLGMLAACIHPTIGRMATIGLPVKLSETPGEVALPPPLLGEHTDAVLAEYGL